MQQDNARRKALADGDLRKDHGSSSRGCGQVRNGQCGQDLISTSVQDKFQRNWRDRNLALDLQQSGKSVADIIKDLIHKLRYMSAARKRKRGCRIGYSVAVQ